MYKIVFIFFMVINFANAQSFGSKFLPLTIEGSKEQLLKYNTYLSIKDSVKVERDKKGQIKIINNSRLPSKQVDSLVKYCNYITIFNDSLFHLKKRVLLIDTFYFFNDTCHIIDDMNFTIVKDINAVKSKIPFDDTIKLKSIRVYRNNFVLAMQHSRSLYEAHFYFRLVANLPPRLQAIYKEYPLYGW